MSASGGKLVKEPREFLQKIRNRDLIDPRSQPQLKNMIFTVAQPT